MGPSRSCWNGTTSTFSRRRLLRRGLEFHVCTINKSNHTKKVLFNDPRIPFLFSFLSYCDMICLLSVFVFFKFPLCGQLEQQTKQDNFFYSCLCYILSSELAYLSISRSPGECLMPSFLWRILILTASSMVKFLSCTILSGLLFQPRYAFFRYFFYLVYCIRFSCDSVSTL